LSAATKRDDEKLLTEIRERYDYAFAQWGPIRDEGKTDMRYVAGDPWDPADRKAREAAGRPCLSLDELNQYFNQVINDVRANPRAMKFAPTGRGATDQTAEFYSNKAREIEYRSKGQIVYTTAFQNAVERGYGFCRVNTRYVSDTSFDQELWLEMIANPDSVLLDPDAIMPDSSDMGYGFVVESRNKSEFTRAFPHAKITDFGREVSALAPKWIQGEKILISEYWTFKTAEKTLLLVKPRPLPGSMLGLGPQPQAPQAVYKEDLAVQPAADDILDSRTVETRTVCQYLTNGVEILKTTEWAGKYIPIVSCFGKVLYLDNGSGATERQILSMTRLARDPFMAYCFYATCEIEVVGSTTKNPYWAYENQLSAAQLTAIQQSIHEPVAVLLAKPTTEATGQTILPLPVRNYQEVQIQGLSVGREEMRRSVQAAMGSTPLPTQAQRRNEKSGKALERMDQSAQRGSFHFVDHYNGMIQHVGVIVEDLIDKIYDTARDVGVRKPDETAEVVAINQPQQQDSQKPFLPSTQGDHQVTVSTGPSFDSERDAASEFADLLMQTPFAPRIGDLAVKLKGGGPIMDQIAERLTPPEFAKAKDGEAPNPQQLTQELGQAKAQLQQLEQLAQQMKSALDADQAKQAATVKMKELEIASREKVADQDRAAKIEIARITAAKQAADLDAEAAEERIALGIKLDADAQEAERQRQHELDLEATKHAHAIEIASRPSKKTVTNKTLNRTPEGVITGGTEVQEEVNA